MASMESVPATSSSPTTVAAAATKVVLACFGDHKRELNFSSSAQEILSFKRAFLATFSDILESGVEENNLVVQLKSEVWGGEFLDMTDDQSIPNHSVVKVALTSPSASVQRLAQQIATGSGNLIKMRESESKALSRLFPSSSSRKRPTPMFDPKAECVAAALQRKKKATGASGRPSNVVVFMLPKFTSNVPRGRHRSQLETIGRKKTLKFSRNMSHDQVSNTIRRGFAGVVMPGTYFKYLDCVDNKLRVSEEQEPDGSIIINRKSAVYLMQAAENVQVPEEVDAPPNNSPVSKDEHQQRSNSDSSSDGESDLPVVNFGRIMRANSLNTPGESSASIIQQQNIEYEQSLQRDRQKVENAERKERDLEILQQVRLTLLEQLSTESVSGEEVLKLVFKLPDGSKVEGTFKKNSKPKVLYEFIFAKSTLDTGFTIATTFPRNVISVMSDTSIGDLHLEGLLAVTNEEDSPPPLSYLTHEDYSLPKVAEQPFLTVLETAKSKRESFMKGLKLQRGTRSSIVRNEEYDSILKLYQEPQLADTLSKYPFRIHFVGEKGIDLGGVCRDAFTAFFDVAYRKYFDGSTLLTPAIHPAMDTMALKTLGCIVSHVYLTSGILPVRIAFPCLAQILLPHDHLTIPDDIYLQTFYDSLSVHDQGIIKIALDEIQQERVSFSDGVKASLHTLLSLYSCRELPRPANLRRISLQIAKFQFELQPSGAIAAMKGGIAVQHKPFWKAMTLGELYRIYCALSVSPAKVIKMLEDIPVKNKAEQRVLGYLHQYIGNISNEQLCDLLRFITGCGVCIGPISVTFNGLDGFERRPMSHTCSNTLDLPSTYSTYMEFKHEFDSILKNVDVMWKMDSY